MKNKNTKIKHIKKKEEPESPIKTKPDEKPGKEKPTTPFDPDVLPPPDRRLPEIKVEIDWRDIEPPDDRRIEEEEE